MYSTCYTISRPLHWVVLDKHSSLLFLKWAEKISFGSHLFLFFYHRWVLLSQRDISAIPRSLDTRNITKVSQCKLKSLFRNHFKLSSRAATSLMYIFSLKIIESKLNIQLSIAPVTFQVLGVRFYCNIGFIPSLPEAIV